MGGDRRRVVITGAGVVSSLGVSPAALHGALCEGESGIAPVELFDLDGVPTRVGGQIRGFAPGDYLGKGNFRPLDRTAQLTASAAQLALDASGLGAGRDEESGDELGLVLGTMFGSVHTISEFDRRALVAGPQYVKPLDFANSVINAAAGQTAIWHQLRGVNSTVAGGPTAGLQALAYAADLIRIGRTEALLAGGVEELCFESFFGFSRTGWMAPGCVAQDSVAQDSVAQDSVAQDSTSSPPCPVPLAAGRNGFTLGEGAALLMLEEAGAARRRGARVLAEVRGHGSAFDCARGHDESSARQAVARALRLALDDAAADPEEIDAASLAASGTVTGDRHEALGFGDAFGERARDLPVTAVKSMLGETLGASGALQTLALVAAMEGGVLPGIRGLDARDEDLPLEQASPANRELEIRLGMVHALGLDGNTCALVISKGEEG